MIAGTFVNVAIAEKFPPVPREKPTRSERLGPGLGVKQVPKVPRKPKRLATPATKSPEDTGPPATKTSPAKRASIRPSGPAFPVPDGNCDALRKVGLVAERLASIAERGGCVVAEPVRFSIMGQRYRVALTQPAVVNCAMAQQLVNWLDNHVQPAALEIIEQPVVRMTVAASYTCRTRNNQGGSKISEHGLANAFDVSDFVFADGTNASVLFGWGDGGKYQKFLQRIHADACRYFSTVIGPEGDRWHVDHFHLDLGKHGSTGTYRVCQ